MTRYARSLVTTLALALALTLATAGCKKDGESAGGGGEPEGPSTAEQLKTFAAETLPPIQKAVPADGPALTLEAKLIDKDRVVAAVPKGWEAGVVPGSFSPPDDAKLGFMTKYSVGSTCDGTCTPKDWKAASDDDFTQFQGDQFTIVKDEALSGPTGRLLVATADGGRKTYLVVTRYKEGASRYYTCHATLEEEAAGLLPAFEQACAANVALFLQ